MARAPQQRRSAAKVRAVLAAARELADEPGAEPLTTRRLAVRSGVPVATLYRYFADVDEVLDVLVAEHAGETAAVVDAALGSDAPAPAGPPAAAIAAVSHRIVDAVLDLYERRPELARRLANPQLAARQGEVDQRIDHALAARLAEHLAAAGLVAPRTPVLERFLEVQWDAAGVLLGAVLAADLHDRPAAEAELRALVDHFAVRLATRWPAP